ncbi:alkaline serine protease Alp1 [Colletotrichum truncatum]|uniref:Alkaline serine protease Alp1 n=1 Tax=Colletotrichum truncatum TaxID=5467 RepID=A0ACC3YE56_COLTU
MTFIRFVTLLFTFVSLCFAQRSLSLRPSISGFSNHTLSRAHTSHHSTTNLVVSVTTPISASGTSSAPASTVTVSNGETIIVPVGVLVVAGPGGGSFITNGLTTPLAAGTSAVSGSGESSSNDDPPDPEKSTDPDDGDTLPTSQASATTSSIEATSATLSATPTSTGPPKYNIWAKEGTSKQDADGFYNTLVGVVGNKDSIESILDEKNIPYLWRTPLTTAQLDKVRADRVVDKAAPDEQVDITDPDAGAAKQRRADVKQDQESGNPIIDLRMLSTPPQGTLSDFYAYDDTAGKGITIYALDTGPFGFEHSELKAPDPTVTRENINVMNHPYAFTPDSNHGTCVISKIVGKTVGVAKRANLITVRMDTTPGEFDLVKAWQTIRNDIEKKGLHGKAVVTTSIVTYPTKKPEYNKQLATDLLKVLRSILAADVPIVCSAGNDADKKGGSVTPNTLPSVLAKYLPSIIVVGAATLDGRMTSFSQRGDLLSTWAVGEDIQCADYESLTGLYTDSGTSYAAPQIAGLAAYLMSNPEFSDEFKKGSVAKNMQELIKTYSHPRGTTFMHPDIAWNGYYPDCSTLRRLKRSSWSAAQRRQAAAACSRQILSMSTQPASPTTQASVHPNNGGVTTTTRTSIASTATAAVQCNLCGQQNESTLEQQVGCSGVDYVRALCEDDPNCKSWSFGKEDRGSGSVSVCNLYDLTAAKAVAGAPEDVINQCPFKYSDKGC